MEGYMYRKNLYAGIPAENFGLFANNAIGVLEGRLPNNAQFSPYVFTWESDGDMLVPLNFTYYFKGKYRKWAGYYTGTYIDQTIGQRSPCVAYYYKKRKLVLRIRFRARSERRFRSHRKTQHHPQ